MDRIYTLIGKIIQTFQKLEEHLALLVYCHYYCQKGKKFSVVRDKALEQYAKIDKVSLGNKIRKMTKQNIMSKEGEDFIVLDYLTERRNYIAHNFFVENKFEEESDIDTRIEDLDELLQQAQLVETAYSRMLMAELQRLNIIKQ